MWRRAEFGNQDQWNGTINFVLAMWYFINFMLLERAFPSIFVLHLSVDQSLFYLLLGDVLRKNFMYHRKLEV